MDAIFALVKYLVSWLPNPETLPQGLDDAFTTISSTSQIANALFPVATFFTVFVLVLTFESGIQMFNAGNWIYNKLRGSG